MMIEDGGENGEMTIKMEKRQNAPFNNNRGTKPAYSILGMVG